MVPARCAGFGPPACSARPDREALDFLTEAVTHIESGLVVAQLAALQMELSHYHDAARSLDVTPSCLLSWSRKWFAGWPPVALIPPTLAETIRRLLALPGMPAKISTPSLPTGSSSYPKPANRHPAGLCSRWNRLQTGRRGECTSSIARYWQQPVPGSSEASPPPDGLPDAAERQRFEQVGWTTREFTLTPDAAFGLTARQVPFIATFCEAGYSQPRLVVGTDRVRNTLFLAEGPDHRPVEAPFNTILQRFQVTGPPALAAVPPGEATRLDGLNLPESDGYDRLYAVQKALLRHDRTSAAAAAEQIRTDFPGHRLAKFAELAMARYDAHPVKLLAVIKSLLTDALHDPSWQLSHAAALRELNRMSERLALLETEGSGPSTEALLMQSLAQMLLPLPHRQAEAERILKRSVRSRPGAAAGYYLLATLWWEQRRFDDATRSIASLAPWTIAKINSPRLTSARSGDRAGPRSGPAFSTTGR